MPQNTFSTATIAGLVTLWWPIFDPLLVGLGTWIEAHSVIAFPPGYNTLLKAAVEGTLIAGVVRWHIGPTPPPTE